MTLPPAGSATPAASPSRVRRFRASHSVSAQSTGFGYSIVG